jgi:hypothetical protein
MNVSDQNGEKTGSRSSAGTERGERTKRASEPAMINSQTTAVAADSASAIPPGVPYWRLIKRHTPARPARPNGIEKKFGVTRVKLEAS